MFTRIDELARIQELLGESLEGNGRSALVSGTAGSGKTTLLRNISDAAVNAGCIVLSASCVKSERSLPLGMLAQLFDSPELPAETAHRAAELLFGEHRTHTAERGLAEQAQDVLSMQGLARLLLDLSASRSVVICVDDVHHADDRSTVYLLHILRRLHSARVLAVLTERPPCIGPHSPIRTELLRQPHACSVELAPLSAAEVTEVISAHADKETAFALGADCLELTGGNPLLVMALLQDRRGTRASSATVPGGIGSVFGSAVLSCLHSSDPLVLHHARGLALLDNPSQPTLLTRFLRETWKGESSHAVTPKSTACAIDTLNTIGILEENRFRHPAVASIILDDMPLQDRSEWHCQAASLLHETSAPAPVVARHLLGADRASEPWMPETLVSAARELLCEDQGETALACLDLAGRSSTDHQQQAEIHVSLAEAEWWINPLTASRRSPQLMAALRGGRLSGRKALNTFELLLWHGLVAPDDDLLRRLEEMTRHHDTGVRTHAEAVHLLIRCVFPELAAPALDGPTADTDNRPGLSSATVVTNCRLKAVTGLSTVLLHGPDQGAVAAAEQVLSTNRLSESTFHPLILSLATLLYSERVREAVFWSESLLNEATARGAANWQGLCEVFRAWACLEQGDLTGAERYARSALTRMPPEAWGVSIGGPYAVLMRAQNEMGNHTAVAELLNRPVPEEMFGTTMGLHYLHARGRHYLSTRQFDSALADFTACGELMARWRMDQPHLVPWRSSAAECHLGMGDQGRARRLAEEQLSMLPSGSESNLRGVSLRVLAASSPPDRRLQLLNEVVEILQRCGSRLDLAKALFDLGETHQSVGDIAQARIAMRRSRHLAEECHADGLRHPAGLGTEDVRPRGATPCSDGLESLSEAERRVGALAAQGRTNREIAGKLHITVSTVEQHLTRIYRKLNVKRRQDLPAGLRLPMIGRSAVSSFAPAPLSSSLLQAQ